MATPEGRVKERVKKELAKAKAYYHMPVQNGMGCPSLDFIGCHLGRFFGIETKAGKKGPTPRQQITMAGMELAGGKAFLINDETGLDELRAWLSAYK